LRDSSLFGKETRARRVGFMSHTFDKSKLPSRHVSVGPERAPHRSYYYAMGLTEEEIGRPFVGIASAGNDSAPCNTTLDMQADWCRQGVNEAGGMPRRFNTITVTDGIAMGHQGMKSSLASREVIADSVELSVRGHCYDDGDAAPQRPVNLRLWRIDPARPLRKPRRHRRRCVRGGR
jgi:hypothetical protein